MSSFGGTCCHSPLKGTSCIRTLVLHPASSSAMPLEGTLEELDLQLSDSIHGNNVVRALNFEAISYTWGQMVAQSQHSLQVDGKFLIIQPSTDAVLRRFRLPNQPRKLWIDSVCIDQSSIAERNQQVLLMSEIYVRARRVLVWLGDPDWTTKYALEFLNSVVDHGISQFNISFIVNKLYKEMTLGECLTS
jgi:hypothetical protein